MTKIQTQDYEL